MSKWLLAYRYQACSSPEVHASPCPPRTPRRLNDPYLRRSDRKLQRDQVPYLAYREPVSKFSLKKSPRENGERSNSNPRHGNARGARGRFVGDSLAKIYERSL